ncbi:PHP domain-containing protein [Gracilibacillus thailandensis]|uniref:PHP domain-containing protein n=1 Tax=Gracilibacillus thailandensis TaxID=563735 RepID=A0A6N7R237_9BACI|nr:PHP domain-containing protein [Gracilibacillus thailandensis]MRI64786.1 PHP domain-containing protein [Gracilibacillus thailandensis]
MKADLHVHSHYSDGSDSVEELIKQAVKANVTHMSIVDHDTVAGWPEVEEMGELYGVEVIPGVEISAYDYKRNRKVHVLGYLYRRDAPHIKELCTPLLQRRQKNSLWQIEQIRSIGYPLDRGEILETAKPSQTIYKQHIMRHITNKPYSSDDYRHLYRSLFKGDGVANRDITYVDVYDAVEAIILDGGIAVVAHPGQLNSYELIPELVKIGLGGIELTHPDHTKADHQRVIELAKQYDLLMTGGTDYHGKFGIEIDVGDLTSPEIPFVHNGRVRG